ncbi:MAG TPA: hypothetical protein VGB15_23520 [Longimicrobium sp.]|jgi:hypothetical protein
MKKLALNVDELKIQTFETAKGESARGTVLAAGTRVTRCYIECTVSTETNCNSREQIDCFC